MKNILKDKISCYLKFFSGQQLLKINNYIKNKIGNNDEKKRNKTTFNSFIGRNFKK